MSSTITYPVPGDGMPSDRTWPKDRDSIEDPNPILYPPRGYWLALAEAGIPPPDDDRVRSVSLEPRVEIVGSDFEDRPGRSIQSTGMPRRWYSINDDRECLPSPFTADHSRTLSASYMLDVSDWEPGAGYSVEDEVLELLEPSEGQEEGFTLESVLADLSPGEAEVLMALLEGPGQWHGRISALADELGKARTTVSTLMARAKAKLRQALADLEPEAKPKRPRKCSEGSGGRV